ncbi:signal peptidase I [Eshraghiella crossota]|uniref:signal peptidase I n=1 Tax=Eshraghiella crossota TaxID=45851 RepID=UPI004027A2B6
MRSSSKSKNILNTIGNFLSTFITAVIAFVAIAFVLIRLMGWNMFSVDSSSMTPKLPVNSLITVQKIDPQEIKVGDIVTYILNSNNILVTHRVVEIDSAKQTFTTKGDANTSNDSAPVHWGNVVGKVVFCVPGLGTPLRIITAEENRIAVISVIVGLFLLSLFWDILIKNKSKKEEYKQSGTDIQADNITEKLAPQNSGLQ